MSTGKANVSQISENTIWNEYQRVAISITTTPIGRCHQRHCPQAWMNTDSRNGLAQTNKSSVLISKHCKIVPIRHLEFVQEINLSSSHPCPDTPKQADRSHALTKHQEVAQELPFMHQIRFETTKSEEKPGRNQTEIEAKKKSNLWRDRCIK